MQAVITPPFTVPTNGVFSYIVTYTNTLDGPIGPVQLQGNVTGATMVINSVVNLSSNPAFNSSKIIANNYETFPGIIAPSESIALQISVTITNGIPGNIIVITAFGDPVAQVAKVISDFIGAILVDKSFSTTTIPLDQNQVSATINVTNTYSANVNYSLVDLVPPGLEFSSSIPPPMTVTPTQLIYSGVALGNQLNQINIIFNVVDRTLSPFVNNAQLFLSDVLSASSQASVTAEQVQPPTPTPTPTTEGQEISDLGIILTGPRQVDGNSPRFSILATCFNNGPSNANNVKIAIDLDKKIVSNIEGLKIETDGKQTTEFKISSLVDEKNSRIEISLPFLSVNSSIVFKLLFKLSTIKQGCFEIISVIDSITGLDPDIGNNLSKLKIKVTN